MRIEGIDHVALVVRDIDRSIRWYADVLGHQLEITTYDLES